MGGVALVLPLQIDGRPVSLVSGGWQTETGVRHEYLLTGGSWLMQGMSPAKSLETTIVSVGGDPFAA